MIRQHDNKTLPTTDKSRIPVPPNQFYLCVSRLLSCLHPPLHTHLKKSRIFFCHRLNLSLDHILIGIPKDVLLDLHEKMLLNYTWPQKQNNDA